MHRPWGRHSCATPSSDASARTRRSISSKIWNYNSKLLIKVVWERDTVWRQMIGQERRGESGDGQPKAIGESPNKVPKPALIEIPTPAGPLRITRRWVFIAIAIAVLTALLNNPILDRVEPSNCFAVLCFATILWATEVSSGSRSRYRKITPLYRLSLYL